MNITLTVQVNRANLKDLLLFCVDIVKVGVVDGMIQLLESLSDSNLIIHLRMYRSW